MEGMYGSLTVPCSFWIFLPCTPPRQTANCRWSWPSCNILRPGSSERAKELSRLGGGIGTRGPGESKLESDRRHIKERIRALEEQLEGLVKNRELHRKQRAKSGIFRVAIAGYTNAGKSTLLNALTHAGVKEKDELFATLDPDHKKICSSFGQ